MKKKIKHKYTAFQPNQKLNATKRIRSEPHLKNVWQKQQKIIVNFKEEREEKSHY